MQTKTPVKWITKTLNEVCIFKSGTTIDKQLEKEYGELIYAKVGDMNLEGNEVSIIKSSRYANFADINESQIIPIGSVIFPKRGGAIATNKKRRIIKPTIVDLNTMAIKCKEELSDEYFYFWFKTIDLTKISNGTTIPQINNYSFDNLKISYPNSITEQQRIVEILDMAFEDIDQLTENAKQNLQNAKDLFESYLNKVFTSNNWEEKTLGEVCDLINRGVSPKYMEENGLCVLNQKCIRNHEINYDLARLHDNKLKPVNPERLIKLGDVLINSTGTGTLGRVAQVRNNPPNATVDSHVTIVRPKSGLFYNDFFGYALILIENKIAESGEGCGGQTELSRDKVKNIFTISYPDSITEQHAIVGKLDKLKKQTKQLEQIYQQKIELAEELKQSILQKAFKGEL